MKITGRKYWYDDFVAGMTEMDKFIKKDEEIRALDRQKESEDRYYKERRERLVEEKEKLLRLRDNKQR
jgi:hypothetical protein